MHEMQNESGSSPLERLQINGHDTSIPKKRRMIMTSTITREWKFEIIDGPEKNDVAAALFEHESATEYVRGGNLITFYKKKPIEFVVKNHPYKWIGDRISVIIVQFEGIKSRDGLWIPAAWRFEGFLSEIKYPIRPWRVRGTFFSFIKKGELVLYKIEKDI